MFFFISELLKSVTGSPRSGHKYIKRYRRGDKWLYVYHDGAAHGRPLSQEHVDHLHELATLGNHDAKGLVESVSDHSEKHLSKMRELHDLGNDDAKAWMASHGINRSQEIAEDAEAARLVALERLDPIDRPLDTTKRDDLLGALLYTPTSGFGLIKTKLATHQSDRHATSLVSAGVNLDSIKKALADKHTIREILKEFHIQMSRVDTAHSGFTSSNSDVIAAGGYGNLAYNTAIKKLESPMITTNPAILPPSYSELHKRFKSDSGTFHVTDLHDIGSHRELLAIHDATVAERAAEEARSLRLREEERRAAEVVALGHLSGSMAHHMATLLIASGVDVPSRKAIEMDRAVRSIFGKVLRKEDWPYTLTGGNEMRLTSCSVGDSALSMHFRIYNATGEYIAHCDRVWNIVDGAPHMYNSRMFAESSSDVRSDDPGDRYSFQINKNQQALMMAHTTKGTITGGWVDVGAYTWANCGFSFKDPRELASRRSDFKNYLKSHFGVEVSNREMEAFTEPCHFAGFDVGKATAMESRRPSPLSPEQISSGKLDGVGGHIALKPAEISSGETKRIAAHAGKAFMKGNNWSGKWSVQRANNDNPAFVWFDNYQRLKNKTTTKMSAAYQSVQASALLQRQGVVAATPSTGPPSAAPSRRAEDTPRTSSAPSRTDPLIGALAHQHSMMGRHMVSNTPNASPNPGSVNHWCNNLERANMGAKTFRMLCRLHPADLAYVYIRADLSAAARLKIRKRLRSYITFGLIPEMPTRTRS